MEHRLASAKCWDLRLTVILQEHALRNGLTEVFNILHKKETFLLN